VSGPEAIRRTWALTKGHKGQLALLVLAGVLLEVVVGAAFGWIPVVGWVVSGTIAGLVTAVWLVAGALVFRAARIAPASTSSPA